MPENQDIIYRVDRATKAAVPVKPVSFQSIGVKERSDLQEWLVKHPDMLGEPLLIVAKEFASFAKSDRRVDILALDKSGALTIVELKLKATNSHAELQAIRYAAFCSTMTMDRVVEEHAKYRQCDKQAALESICQFLGVEELGKLQGQPRIIIAAGAFEDQELTGAILWLRKFNVNISCVELTPYQLPSDDNAVMLVPRIIIPTPEAIDFMQEEEKKEAAETVSSRTNSRFQDLWSSIAQTFNPLAVTAAGNRFAVGSVSIASYQKVAPGTKLAHYEWARRARSSSLDVCIHFESDDEQTNEQNISRFMPLKTSLESMFSCTVSIGTFGDIGSKKGWRELRIRIPTEKTIKMAEMNKAAQTMKTLIEQTASIFNDIH